MHETDWSKIIYFTKKEFQGQADLINPETLYKLDTARKELKERIFISPIKGAIARFGGSSSSQHYVGPTRHIICRQTTALDVFIEGIPFLNFMNLIGLNLFTGIGIYVDTVGPDGMPWTMFHLDIRTNRKAEEPLIWIANKQINVRTGKTETVYHYPEKDASKWLILQRRSFFTEKVYR